VLILNDGTRFAEFRRDAGAAPPPASTFAVAEGVRFDETHLAVTRDVGLSGQKLGSLLVLSDLREIEFLINRYAVFSAMITVGAALFSLLLSSVLQRWIAKPIEELETLSNRISNERNYALRAPRTSDDEVGRLADAFNDMLDQIEARDSELQVARDNAEKVAQQVSSLYEVAQRANRDLERENQDRQLAEAALLEKSDALERSNVELQQFAYVASHDLQEPLRMVTMFTELLKERYSDQLDEKGLSYIDYAVDGAARMKQLIRELLEFSRVGQMQIDEEPVDCNTLVEEVLSVLQVSIREAQARFQISALPTLYHANSTRIFQLFQNLISNAIKFRGEQSPVIEIAAHEEEGFWHFSLRDNGIGFEPRFAERIFMLFQRLHTRAEYEGTGIGLALCKKIVTTHGGDIRVETQVGEGTTFYFSLPSGPIPAQRKPEIKAAK